MKEAAHYSQLDEETIICNLCPHNCKLSEGKIGKCQVRQNEKGLLYTKNYSMCSSYALDPIEKKPLYHFYPGLKIISIGTWGCNFSCKFCQNWNIAQEKPQVRYLLPEAILTAVKQAGKECIGVAYTYSEPTVWYEFVIETAEIIKQANYKNVLVTNGFINDNPFKELLTFIDAVNIDVKAFNNKFYKEICGGNIDQVKKTVELAASNCHVEITTLLIPGLNDSPAEIIELASWLAKIDKNIPLHFSRYFPSYKLNIPPTPLSVLQMAYEAAKEYLNHVYVGNINANQTSNTYCPNCSSLLIDRINPKNYLEEKNKCPVCKSVIKLICDRRH